MNHQQSADEHPGAAQRPGVSQLAGSNLMKYNLRPAARVDTVEHVEQVLSISDVQAELRKGLIPLSNLTAPPDI